MVLTYLKVEQDKQNFIVSPTYNLIKTITTSNMLNFYYDLFDYSLEDLCKFFITEYNAQISVVPYFPHFVISFIKKSDANRFCKDMEKKYIERFQP